MVVALPALRTRGVNLAVATLGLSLDDLRGGLHQRPADRRVPRHGGPVRRTSPGINIDPILHPSDTAAFVLALLVIVGLIVANVRRGRAGRRLLAVRANERAAASLGIGVYGAKLYAFALSAAIAGLAGVCWPS